MENNIAANIRINATEQAKAHSTLNYQTLFYLFVIGSVIGFVLEGLWSIVKSGHWVNHSALIWGPFCIIYGIGAVAVFVISHLLSGKNLVLQFIVYFLSGGLVEYFGSLFQEMLFGSTSWDYSDHFMNIGGRVSLQMALTWGVLGILFMIFLFPFLKRRLGKLNGKKGVWLCLVLMAFMVLNLSATSVVVMRWQNRLHGIEAKNTIEQIADHTYGNERMERIFTNMQFANMDRETVVE